MTLYVVVLQSMTTEGLITKNVELFFV